MKLVRKSRIEPNKTYFSLIFGADGFDYVLRPRFGRLWWKWAYMEWHCFRRHRSFLPSAGSSSKRLGSFSPGFSRLTVTSPTYSLSFRVYCIWIHVFSQDTSLLPVTSAQKMNFSRFLVVSCSIRCWCWWIWMRLRGTDTAHDFDILLQPCAGEIR